MVRAHDRALHVLQYKARHRDQRQIDVILNLEPWDLDLLVLHQARLDVLVRRVLVVTGI